MLKDLFTRPRPRTRRQPPRTRPPRPLPRMRWY